MLVTTGDRIRNRRKELGLSVDQLADSLGKNRATIYRYESDEIENMSINILIPLSKVLKCTPAYLMGWEESPENEEPKIDTIAAHALRDLTDEEQQKILEYAKFIKAQRTNKK